MSEEENIDDANFDDSILDDIAGDNSEYDMYVESEVRVRGPENKDKVEKVVKAKKEKEAKEPKRKGAKRLRYKKKNTFASATLLRATEAEIQAITNGLTAFYEKNKEKVPEGKSVDAFIKEIIKECETGWIMAPNSLIQRVQWKTKCKFNITENKLDHKEVLYKTQQKKLKEEVSRPRKNLYPGFSADILRQSLPLEEQKFWKEREEYYRNEFEFNNSSDWSLLLQVLLEELTQFRLVKIRMENPLQDIEFQLSESYKRLLNAQKTLGITREQREAGANETEGNIAQLGVLFEAKKKKMDKIKEKDRFEEESFMIKHNNHEGLKLLPDDLARDMQRGDFAEETLKIDDYLKEIEDKKKTKDDYDDHLRVLEEGESENA